jgi:hypothetical protein
MSASRTWNSLSGFVGNVAIAVVVIAVTILNLVEGQWRFVALGVAVLVGFGVAPAIQAHRQGQLYVTRNRARVGATKSHPGSRRGAG